MNILVFNWQDRKNPQAGGAEVHLHEIFKRIVSKGHKVTLVCSRFRGGAPKDYIDGIIVHRVGYRSLFNFAVPLWYMFYGGEYDIVIDDVNKIPFYTPVYVKKPLVAVFHHLFGKSIWRETNPIAASYVWIAEWLVPRIYRDTFIVSVSESTKEDLTKRGIPKSNISIIHNAVDHNLYNPGHNVTDGESVIGFIGRIKKYKSIEHLIRAYRKIREKGQDIRLVIVGDGDHLGALKRYAKKLKVDDYITFTGHVSADEKVRLIQNMKVCVNTSSKEGWGLTVIEANACGIPVIGADVPGLRDSIIDGETGILYPFGSIDQLTDAIETVIKDNEFRKRLSKNSLKWANNFNWDKSADAFLEIIETVKPK